MEDRVKELLTAIKAGLSRMYGPRLRGVYLYGSRARGDHVEDSDADVLVVLDKVSDYGQEIQATGEFVSDLSIDFGMTVSRLFVSEDEWNRAPDRFLRNVRRDAIPA